MLPNPKPSENVLIFNFFLETFLSFISVFIPNTLVKFRAGLFTLYMDRLVWMVSILRTLQRALQKLNYQLMEAIYESMLLVVPKKKRRSCRTHHNNVDLPNFTKIERLPRIGVCF